MCTGLTLQITSCKLLKVCRLPIIHQSPKLTSLLSVFGTPVKYILVMAHDSCYVLQSYQMQMHSQLWTALARVISAASTTKGLS